jgi:hypothetical protein
MNRQRSCSQDRPRRFWDRGTSTFTRPDPPESGTGTRYASGPPPGKATPLRRRIQIGRVAPSFRIWFGAGERESKLGAWGCFADPNGGIGKAGHVCSLRLLSVLGIGQIRRLLAIDFVLRSPRIRSFLLLPSFGRPIYYHLPKSPFVELSR